MENTKLTDSADDLAAELYELSFSRDENMPLIESIPYVELMRKALLKAFLAGIKAATAPADY